MFPGADNIHSVSFSPDGRTAYCLVDGESVDLWSAAVSIWPEAVGSIVLTLTVLWVLILWRVRRYPQVVGAPYCRRCNYNVVSQAPDATKPRRSRVLPAPGTLCTECGTDLSVRRPRRGRSTFRRLWLPTTIAATALVGYAIMLAAGLPRAGPTSTWLGIWSTWIDDLSKRYQLGWLEQHRTQVACVMRVDTETGEIIGRLCTLRGYPGSEMLTSPDGASLFVAEGRTTLVRISTFTGWTARTDAQGHFDIGVGDPGLTGFTGPEDDPWLYYAVLDPIDKRSRLIRWRPNTGEQQIVVDEPAYKGTLPNGNLHYQHRRYALLRWPEGVATASAPSFTEAYHTSTYTVVVRAPAERGGQVLHTFENKERFMSMSDLATTQDGSRIYVSNMSNGLIGFDPKTGERLGTLRPDNNLRSSNKEFGVSFDGNRIFLSVFARSILVRDTQAMRWIGELMYPDEFIGTTTVPSNDGRWLGVVAFTSSGQSGSFTHHLFLYDLKELDKPRPKADPAAPQAPRPADVDDGNP